LGFDADVVGADLQHGSRNAPCRSATPDHAQTLVVELTICRVASGTTAPEESETTPDIVPLMS
jgi:hypothetical protein